MKYIYVKNNEIIKVSSEQENIICDFMVKHKDDNYEPVLKNGQVTDKRCWKELDGELYNSQDQINNITKKRISSRYSIESEIKINRLMNCVNAGKYDEEPDKKQEIINEFNEYNSFVEQMRAEGKEKKDEFNPPEEE